MLSSHIQTYNQKDMSEFVAKVVQENPEWVKHRRLDYLYKKLTKQMKFYVDFAQRCLSFGFPLDWIPTPDKMLETHKEISLWSKTEYKKFDITDADIDDAKIADCSRFLKIEMEDHKRRWANCPFHQETKPSLCCFENNGWYCFGCSTGGNAIDLVIKLYGLKFKEAVKFITHGTY